MSNSNSVPNNLPKANIPESKIDITDSIFNKLISFSPYICILLAIFLIILLVLYLGKDTDETEVREPPRPTYSGNKGLDLLYSDADGNNPSKNAKLTSLVTLSTNEHSCKYEVTYDRDNFRDVNCISGCSIDAEPDENSNDKENEEFCNQYRYSAVEGGLKGNLLNRMLDDEYLQTINQTPTTNQEDTE